MPFATVRRIAEAPAGKDLRYLQLWDCYGGLLTDNQREICEEYYVLDLSLSEIAEEKGVSKQSVSQVLQKSRRLLDRYEEKLRHVERDREYSLSVSAMMTDVTRALEAFKAEHPKYSAEIDGIIEKVSVGETVEAGSAAADREEV